MEYRFRAKKSWNIPDKVTNIILLGFFISWFFPRYIDEQRWIGISLIILGYVFLVFYYRELSQKIILTISDAGISYSGNDYIFANELKNIPYEQLSKILIADHEPVGLMERWFLSKVCLLDQQERYIKNLDSRKWQSLDELNLEQALMTCLKDKVEIANRAKILEMEDKQRGYAIKDSTIGIVGNYFAYASVGLALICFVLAALDINDTLAWGQYEYLIGGIALIIAVICLAILARSITHLISLFVLTLIFTTVMTLFIHQSLLLLNYHLGQQKSYQFEKVFQTKDHEVWRTATGVEVKCVPSPRKLHDYETWIVRIGILGVVRTGFTEVCMLPQEIKQGKSA